MKILDSDLNLPDQILLFYPTKLFETVRSSSNSEVCNEPLMYTCETMSHYMSQWYMKNCILSCRIHTVLFIFSDLTTWAQRVRFLPVILLISSAFNVTHLWTSLLSVSAHVWAECGTVPTTAAQVCALPWFVVTFFTQTLNSINSIERKNETLLIK